MMGEEIVSCVSYTRTRTFDTNFEGLIINSRTVIATASAWVL